MTRRAPLTFKLVTEDWELEAINRLNYRAFVEEIPQHPPNAAGRLVDRFQGENTYVICLDGHSLVGMIAGRGERPFSLDRKLADLDSHLPPGRRALEVRLLAVERGHRTGFVFAGLVRLLFQHARAVGYDLAIISATTRQSRLYRHLGFVPFGRVTGTGDALFQPMYLTLETFEARSRALLARVRTSNLLPGPITVSDEARAANAAQPVSHRGESFAETLQLTRRHLCRLTGARSAEVLVGSGSLANDVIAGQLSLEVGRGLILSNGEFGDRLVDHATRFRLPFDVVRLDWGRPFDEETLRGAIGAARGLTWLWAVHSETSTGVLNDLALLERICGKAGLKLCVDCISSIGTVPVDLSRVYLASCVSGKGLAAFPGLAMVFYSHVPVPAPARLPRYLDLGLYAAHSGVPFTHSSNLLGALKVVVEQVDWNARFDDLAGLSAWLRTRLRKMGARIVAPDCCASPAAITLALPRVLQSESIGRELDRAGYLLHYRSAYLLARNWMQICALSPVSRHDLEGLLAMLHGYLQASHREPDNHPVHADGPAVRARRDASC